MTDEARKAADEKVKWCMDLFPAYVRKAQSSSDTVLANIMRTALADLDAAEAERVALDKPRLLTARERAEASGPTDYSVVTRGVVCGYAAIAITDDRADILAQAEKLPRHYVNGINGEPPHHNHSAILLSDLRSLLNGN